MTTRVVGDSEVSLNAVRFPIIGKVRASIASIYPEKRITGDFDKDSQRHVSVQTWDDHRGGMGVERWSPLDADRSLQTTSDITNKGHLLLIGEITGVSTPPNGIPLIGELNGDIVAAFGTDIRDLGVSWGTSEATLGGTPTDVRNGNLDGTQYLVFCYTTGYDFSSSVATWTASTKDAVNIEFHDERFWGIDVTGQLWYTFTMGSSEVDDARLLLDRSEVVTGLLRARGPGSEFILYAVTNIGLYAHDIGNRRFVQITGITLPDNNTLTHERPAVMWREKIYLAAGRGILEYDPGTGALRDVGWDQGGGVRATEDGFITCMGSSFRELFVGTTPVSGNDSAIVMAWNGRGWRKIAAQAAGNIESIYVTEKDVSSISSPDGPHVWWGANSGAAFIVVRNLINIGASLTSNIDGFTYFTPPGTQTNLNERHIFPWFDGGQRDLTKIALRVKVEVTGTDTNTAVDVFFAIDETVLFTKFDDTYTNDSTFNTGQDRITGDGVTTFFFPSVATPSGTEFTSIKLAVGLMGTGNSPDVLSVSLEYLKILDEKLAFDFELDFTQPWGGRSSQQLRAAYATARALKTLPELTYRDDDGGTRNYYVKVLAGQGDELTGHEERGSQLVRCVEI